MHTKEMLSLVAAVVNRAEAGDKRDPSILWLPLTRLHGVITQKTTV
jgi:hypothetical protein